MMMTTDIMMIIAQSCHVALVLKLQTNVTLSFFSLNIQFLLMCSPFHAHSSFIIRVLIYVKLIDIIAHYILNISI